MRSWRKWSCCVAAVVLILLLLALLLNRDVKDEGARLPVVSTSGEGDRVEFAAPALLTDSAEKPTDRPLPAEDGAPLTGVVVDEAGRPIAEAEVELFQKAEGEIGEVSTPKDVKSLAVGVTSPEGRFRFSVSATESDYRLFAQARGYRKGSVELRVPSAGLEDVKIVLETGCIIEGTVVDADGEPVDDVIVYAQGGPKGPEESIIVEGKVVRGFFTHSDRECQSLPTDESGAFALWNLVPGDWRLSAGEESGSIGFSGENMGPLATVSVAKGERRRIELVLPTVSSEHAIEGVVLSEHGRPVVGARLWATQGAGQGLPLCKAESDDTGRFSLKRFSSSIMSRGPSAMLFLACQAEGFEPVSDVAAFLGTKDVVIKMAPRQRGTIVGSVRDRRTQEPVTEAQVLVWQVETTWGDRFRPTIGAYDNDVESGKGLVDAGGRFTLEDVPAGVATLQVYAKGYGLALHDNVNVRRGQTTETTILIGGAGTLEVHIVPLGSLAEVESECWLELSPVAVVGLVDDSRWSSPNGSSSLARTHAPSEVTASMRFAINCGQFGGQGIEYKTKDPRVAKFELQPGDYTVRASMRDQRVVQEADGAWHNFAAKAYREVTATVVPGQTTVATLEIGGTGIVQGSVPPPGGDARPLVALTPGEDSEFFRAHEQIVGHDVMPLFTEAMGAAMFMTRSRGEYRFYHVALGTHTVSLYVTTEEGYVLRGTRVVEVTSEGPAVADF